MALATGDVIGILADNLRLRRSVLPISARHVTAWARDLQLPRGGETVLYTGQMYQLIPYIEQLVQMEERLADSPLARFTPLARRMNRVFNVSAFMAHPGAAARSANNRILGDIARLLTRAGVTFGYLYEDDLYSGALAYDLGADEAVAVQARRVHRVFKKHGVKTVITVDPHTTNMLRSVYPRLVAGYDVQVHSYLEVLAARQPAVHAPLANQEVVLHDSCVYARYEKVVQEPRVLLQNAGLTVKEPDNAGRFTWCCGGPLESLYPEKARAVAAKRVDQLRQAAPEGVTMCPLCLVNLRKAAGDTMRLEDISQYLRRAYGA
jgi:Fe-S oxidoreductase